MMTNSLTQPDLSPLFSATVTSERIALVKKTFLTLLLTAEALRESGDEALRPFGITGQQSNVLYILYEAGEAGLSCQEIGERLVKRSPDISRLLDRLAERQLCVREHSTQDRRVVIARLTLAGKQLVEHFVIPFTRVHLESLAPLGDEELLALCQTLQQIRKVRPTHDSCR